MARPSITPFGFKVEAAIASAEINAELVCTLRTTGFLSGTQPTEQSYWSEQMYDLQTKRTDQ